MSSDRTPNGPYPAIATGVPARTWYKVDLERNPPGRDPLAGSRLGATLQNGAAFGTRPKSLPRSVHSRPDVARPAPCVFRDGAKAVPPQAFVVVGRRLDAVGNAGQPAGRLANDNRPSAGGRRTTWRDMIFLALLAATVAGAFWGGRLHAAQNVIVVPGPSSYRSVVT